MLIDLMTWYLEMTAPADLLPSRSTRSDLLLAHVGQPMPELNRFLYTAVGGDWYWTDRLPWTYRQWHGYLNRPELETWVLSASGVPAGYFELEMQSGHNVEVAYFGVLPAFIGQGLGGHLLTAAVERAWTMGAKRVWLHTCSLDHPNALKHYCARGFRIYKKEVTPKEEPDLPTGPWLGAGPRSSVR